MKAQDFLKDKLKSIAQKYEDIKIRCEFRLNTNTYLIKIIPTGLFETNEEYIQDEINLEIEFEELFPQDEILFITEGSLNEIRTVDFEFGYHSFTIEENRMEEESFEIETSEEINNIIEPKRYNFALAA